MSYLISKLRKSKIASATLALILAFSVLLSTFSGLTILANTGSGESELDIWELDTGTTENVYDGVKTQPTQGGDGSAADKAILITTPEELAYVISSGGGGKFYKLTTDIYLNDPEAIRWSNAEIIKSGYTFREWCGGSFSGTIDGDGHTIYGMFLPHGTGNYFEAGGAGFITSIPSGGSVTIKNLGIDKSYAHTVGYTSAFIGVSSAATVVFENCYVGENVLIKGHSATAFMATGKTDAPTISITNCYSLATLEAMGSSNAYEGLVGDFWSGSVVVKNSYNADGYIYNKSNCSGSENNYGAAAGHANAATTVRTLDNMKGEDVLTSNDKMKNLGAAYVAQGEGKYPILAVFAPKGEEIDVWDGTTVEPTKGGDGSAADKAILIETPEELAWVVYTGGQGKYYKLTNDLYLNDISRIDWSNGDIASGYALKNWHEVSSVAEVAVFTGHIDGDGYTVYGMYSTCSPTGYYWSTGGIGLITKATNGEVSVKNLGIDKAYVNNTSHAAAIIGSTSDNTSAVTVDSCYVGEDVTLIGYGAGAIVSTGVNATSVTVSNCYSLATLTTKGGYAGLMSEFYGEGSRVVKNSYNANGPISHTQTLAAGSENNYETVAGSTSANAQVRTLDNMKGEDVLTADTKMKNLGAAYVAQGEGKYPILSVFVKTEEIKVWDKTTAEPTKGGDGTSADEAIIIETAEEFAWVIANGGNDKYYKLAADIYLNNVTKINWAEGTRLDDAYTINYWGELAQVAFSGTIDGDGHTIYGMFAHDYPSVYYEAGGFGLIKKIATGKTATFKNLGLDKSFNHSTGYAAGFVGVMESGGSVIFENCYVGKDVTVKGHSACAFLATGKLDAPSVSIINCYSLATLEAKGPSNAYEGLVGDFWTGSVVVKNSYNADGYVYNKSNCSGSENNYGLAAGHANAATTVRTLDNMKGAGVLTSDDKMKNLGDEWTEMGEGNFPVQWIFSGKEKPTTPPGGDEPGGETPAVDVWDGTVVEPTKGGDGSSAENAILVETPEEFAWIFQNGGNSKYYKLANDIYLNDITKVTWTTGEVASGHTPNAWGSTRTFNATIDGDGHVVHGLYFNNAIGGDAVGNTGNGLIPSLVNGVVTIKGLGIDNSYIAGTNASAFVGHIGSSNWNVVSNATLTIDQCYVGSNVKVKGHNASAFLSGALYNEAGGLASTTITNCYNLGTLEGSGSSGLYAGAMWTYARTPVSVTNSYNATGAICTLGQTISAEYNYALEGSGNKAENTTLVSADNMKGADVLENASKMNLLGEKWVAVGDGKYPVPLAFEPAPAEPEIDIWDGTVVEPTKGGDGSSAENAILVETPEEFAWIFQNGGNSKYYKLANDIYLNDITKVTWTTGEVASGHTPNAWGSTRTFNATIDGDGHVVHGLYFNNAIGGDAVEGNTGNGLIPSLVNGVVTIKGLGIDNSYIAGTNASAFVGHIGSNSWGVVSNVTLTIDQCYVGSNVKVKGHNASAFLSGALFVADGLATSTITNCYNMGTLEGAGSSGLYAGAMWTYARTPVSVTNSYNATGVVCTLGQTITAANNYELAGGVDKNNATQISADNMKGADVLENASKMNLLGEKWVAVGDGKYPVPDAFAPAGGGEQPGGGEEPGGGETPTLDIWDGTTVEPTGDGSAADKAIEITTPEQLAWVVANGGAGKYYKLANDIYLNAPDAVEWATGIPGSGAQDWNTVLSGAPVFTGHIDGDGHTVYGIYVDHGNTAYGYSPSSGSGLIGKATNGAVSIKNLGIDKVYIHTSTHNAAFIGTTANNESEVVIDSCYVGTDVKIVGAGAAAFIGMAVNSTSTVISNCYNLGTMEAKGGAGLGGYVGLMSEFYGTGSRVVKNSYNANGPISQVQSLSAGSENNYETVAGSTSANATLLNTDQMKAEGGMPNLGEEWADMGAGNYPVPWAFSGQTKPTTPPGGGEGGGEEPPVDTGYWTGETQPTAGGDGTSADKSIIINTANEFAWVIANGGNDKYYKLAADIYLNDATKINWVDGTKLDDAYAIRNWDQLTKVAFSGTIDGDGHTIYGMYINNNPTEYWEDGGVALISRIATGKTATFKNLGFDKAYNHVSGYAAGFVGVMPSGGSVIFENCYVGADVTIKGHSASAFLATGKLDSPSVSVLNCYSLARQEVMGTNNAYAGLVGDFWSGSVVIKNSYNANGYVYNKSNITAANNYGTEAGHANAATTVVTIDNMKGADVLSNPDKMPGLGEEWTNMGDGNFPVQWIFSGKTKPLPEHFDGWDGTTTTEPVNGGDGSSADKAIVIETAAELAYVIKNGGEGKYYILANDIYLNNVDRINWATGTRLAGAENYVINNWFTRADVEPFYGTIDGAGHTVYGIIAVENIGPFSAHNAVGGGFIPKANSGEDVTIKNLGIDCSYIYNSCNASAFIGVAQVGRPTITFDTCYVGENVTVTGYNAGTFLGTSSFNPDWPSDQYVTPTVVIANSVNLGTIIADAAGFAGFVGDSWGGPVGVTKSYNATGAIYQKNSAGTSANNYEAVAGHASMNAELRTPDNMKGADVLTNPAKMTKLGRGYTAMGDGKYPLPWIFSGLPIPEMPDIWEGATSLAEPTKGGDGSSAEQAIIIETSAEFAYVIKVGGQGKYYKLVKDIYLNETDKVDWTTGLAIEGTGYPVTPWFSRADVEPFYGHIDGDGHTVYGMVTVDYTGSYAGVASAGAGLIPKATAGKDISIKNLSVDCAYVHSSSNAAAFIGYAQGPENSIVFDRCSVGKNVTIEACNAGLFVGASTFNPEQEVPEGGELDTRTPSITISSCFSLATTIAKGTGNSFRGFVGDSWGGPVSVTKSFNANGPIYEKNSRGISANNYETVAGHAAMKAELRTPDNMKGLDVLTNFDKMTKLGKQYVPVENDYPKFTDIPAVDTTWDGSQTEPKDTDNDGIIEINNASELAWVVSTGGAGKTYELTADIYLNDVSRENWHLYDVNPWFVWSVNSDSARAFNGTLEGNGHTIYGLYREDDVPTCTDQKQNWREGGLGLFPILSTDAVIRNVHIREAKLSANAAVGAFAGKTHRFATTDKEKNAQIIGCSVDESVSVHGWIVGGMVGGSSDCGVDFFYSYTAAKYSNSGLEGFANAFTGDIWTSVCKINNSYYVGANGAKGSYAYTNAFGTATVKDEFGLTIVALADMLGDKAKTSMKKLDWTVWYTLDGKTPQLRVLPEGKLPAGEGEGGPAITVTAPTKGGDGSSADKAIIIENAAELAYVIKNGGEGKYYKLAKDIYINDITKVDFTTGESTDLDYAVTYWFQRSDVEPFYGHIDGAGHTIYGLVALDLTGNYAGSASGGTGLIPKATAGKDISISNLAIDYAYIHSSSNAGAFIGIAQGPENSITFNRCSVGANVLVEGCNAAAFVGASTFNPEQEREEGEELDTRTPSVTISSCFSLATLNAKGTTSSFRGFVGDSWGGPVSVTKSFNANGPIYEKNSRGISANNYETVAGHEAMKAELRTQANMKGLDVLTNFDKMTKLGKQYVPVENDYPKFTAEPVVDTIWSGAQTEPKDTNGDGIFEIGTGEELAWVVSTGGAGKKYELTADIYLNDVTRENWELYDVNPWFVWSIYAESSRAFNGTLEGNGHTIYGLYRDDVVPECKDQKQNWREGGLGLFPILSTDAVIRNVHIRDSKLSANAAVGAFGGKTMRFDGKTEEGKAKKALIIGCSVDESVSLHGWIVGGFVGGSSDCGVDIYYSYMTAKYSNSGLEGFANAFIGDIWTAGNQMIDCYYVGDNGARGTFSYINVYGTGSERDHNGLKIITKEQMIGAKAKKNMKNLDWDTWYTVDGKTPQIKVVKEGQLPPAAGEGTPGRKWYGLISSGFDGGTGTKADPYLIATPEQLAFLVNNLWQYDTDTYYKITHDIILNDTSFEGWEEEALSWYNGWRSPFVGHLDGDGHIISGLYINDETPNYSALFPIMSHDSSIRRLGIVNSKIMSNDSGDAAMCAPFISFVEHWQPSKNPQFNMPEVSECFADETVYVEGSNVGGLVAGEPSPIKLENCYSTAELFSTSSKSRGTLIGGAWGNDGGPTLINCYGTNSNRDRLVAGTAGQAGRFVAGDSSAINAYADGPGAGDYIKSTIIEFMKGENAKTYMTGFDYDKVWKIVKGGTPVLRCFKNAEKYSCKREMEKVNITFVTNGGDELEPVSGYPRIDKLSADDLPTPERYGYKFAGWYYFAQCDIKFDLEVFPDFDLNLYAKWEPVGFTVTFENTPDPVYDYNSGVEQTKPGVKGYSPRYVHAGVKAMHSLADSKTTPTFLLSYENTLEVGQEYEITFWVTTDTAKQSGEVRIAHAMYGDVHDTVVGDEAAFEYSNLMPGVWKKYTAKFVANAPYILIKAPVGSSLYFDDVQVVPTGEDGKLGAIDNYRPVGILGGLNLVTILIIAGAVLLLGAAAVVAVVVIKKRKVKVDAE